MRHSITQWLELNEQETRDRGSIAYRMGAIRDSEPNSYAPHQKPCPWRDHIFDRVGGTSPVARRMRSAWRETPVLEKIFSRWVFAVVPAIPSTLAVSLSVCPPRSLVSTRVSALVRPKAAAIVNAASFSSGVPATNTAATAAG